MPSVSSQSMHFALTIFHVLGCALMPDVLASPCEGSLGKKPRIQQRGALVRPQPICVALLSHERLAPALPALDS